MVEKYQEGQGSDQLYLEWRLAYQPGELHAVAYDYQGQIVAEDRVVTAGKPAKIGLHADKSQLEPDGQDLLYLYFDVLDKDGNWCRLPPISFILKLQALLAL